MTLDGKETTNYPKTGLFKFTSKDGKFWYGTFRKKEIGIQRMKKDYPNDDYKITEI